MQAPSADTSLQTREYRVTAAQGRLYAKSWHPVTAKTEAPPIVLFHDSLGCVELWRDFPATLSAATGRTVIAYDRLGFGRSSPYTGTWSTRFIQEEAEYFFPALRADMGIKRFVAFGYSVGGAMAAACAARNPDDCEAVILQSAPAFIDDGMLRGMRQAQQDFSRPGQLERLAKYHGDKAAWVLAAWIDTWLSADFSTWRIEQVAPCISPPLLVIQGDQDEYGSLDYPRHIASLASGICEQLVVKNCHHMPHKEYPDIVLNAVMRFLDSLIR